MTVFTGIFENADVLAPRVDFLYDLNYMENSIIFFHKNTRVAVIPVNIH